MDRLGNRDQRRLVKYHLTPLAHLIKDTGFTDITFNERDPVPMVFDVVAMSGGKIIQHGHPAAIGHQGIHEVGTDKASTTRYQRMTDLLHR